MYCSAFQASPLSEKHWDLVFIDMCVCTYMYTSACLLSAFSLVDTYLCWCALMAEQDVLNLDYFRAAPVWAAKQRMVIPWKIHCCVSILLCCLSMPCESTNHNLRSHKDFGIFIPYNTWFIYTAWMRVAFPFHCTPTSLHELTEARRRNRKRTQKAFEYCPPHWVWKSAWGISDQAVSYTSFPSAFGNCNAPLVLSLIFLQRNEF